MTYLNISKKKEATFFQLCYSFGKSSLILNLLAYIKRKTSASSDLFSKGAPVRIRLGKANTRKREQKV